MDVLDKTRGCCEKSSYPLGFMCAALFHDIGKVSATTMNESGNIHAYKHESVGDEDLRLALGTLANDSLCGKHSSPKTSDIVDGLL